MAPTDQPTNPDTLKRQAALRAVAHVESGMRLGLGTGSTAEHAITEIGRKLAGGELTGVTAVATSLQSAAQAERLGIPLEELDERGVDLAIDGMDELDPTLNAVKGLGGALAREKIVAARARTFILIGDASKRVSHLGEKAPVPVEVLPFGWRAASAELSALGCRPALRTRKGAGEPYVSDNGNYILDCRFDAPFDPQTVAGRIKAVPGVLEHGLFLGLADLAYIATEEGVITLP